MNSISAIRSRIEESRVSAPLRAALAQASMASVQDALRALKRGALPSELEPFREEIQRVAPVVESAMATSLVSHDPARRALRHAVEPSRAVVEVPPAEASAPLAPDAPQPMLAAASAAPMATIGSPALNDEDIYCSPDSLQSMLSPAKYLVDIRELASDFTPGNSAFELDRRRPDLASLKLSKDNLLNEVTTLSLANEVMTTFALRHRNKSTSAAPVTEDQLYEELSTMTHPLSLPFDVHQTTVRLGLAAIGTSLNKIALDLAEPLYALENDAFTLAPNFRDKLGLCDKHIEILTQTPLPTDLAIPATVDEFLRYAAISHEQLVELLCNVPIFDEQGTLRSPGQTLASYINANSVPELSCGHVGDNAGAAPAAGPLSIVRAGVLASQADLVRMTHLIRLHKSTGLAFRDLDLLLAIASRIHGLPMPTISTATLQVLARYVEWRERFGLSAESYAALIGQVNEFWRESHQETSLLRQLFDAGARRISQGGRLQDFKVTYLGPLLLGLRLSTLEFEFLGVKSVWNASQQLDAALLSTLYRFSEGFRLLGWTVRGGIELVDAVAPSLLATLAGAPSPAVLTALDQLAWLCATLKDLGLTPQQVLAMLRQSDSNTLYATEETMSRINQLYQDVAPILLGADSFRSYATVSRDPASGGAPIAVSIDWLDELSKPDCGVIDPHGLVAPLSVAQIHEKVAAVLAVKSVAPATSALQGVTTILLAAQEAARQTLAVELGKSLADGGAPAIMPLLDWMRLQTPQLSPHQALTTLLAANLKGHGIHGPATIEELNAKPATLAFMARLSRYLQAVAILGLEDQEIRMAAEHPGWIAPGCSGALDFKSVFCLLHFKRLQSEKASSADWIAYFQKINAPAPDANATHVLARLLGADAAAVEPTMELLSPAPGGPPLSAVASVAKVVVMARHLQLARAMEGGFEDVTFLRLMAQATVDRWLLKGFASRAVLLAVAKHSPA